MNKNSIKQERKVNKRHYDYPRSPKYKKCKDLFIDINKKSEFTDKDINDIRSKFIGHIIQAFFSKLASFMANNVFIFFFIIFILFDFIDTGKINPYAFQTSAVFSLILSLIINFTFKKMNNYIMFIKIGNKLSMSYYKDLSNLNGKDIYTILSIFYRNALSRLLTKPKRVVNFSTHEILRVKVGKLYEDNPRYNYKCVSTGIKPIPENMTVLPIKHLIYLLGYIKVDMVDTEEFREVLKLLRASYTYKISISLK